MFSWKNKSGKRKGRLLDLPIRKLSNPPSPIPSFIVATDVLEINEKSESPFSHPFRPNHTPHEHYHQVLTERDGGTTESNHTSAHSPQVKLNFMGEPLFDSFPEGLFEVDGPLKTGENKNVGMKATRDDGTHADLNSVRRDPAIETSTRSNFDKPSPPSAYDNRTQRRHQKVPSNGGRKPVPAAIKVPASSPSPHAHRAVQDFSLHGTSASRPHPFASTGAPGPGPPQSRPESYLESDLETMSTTSGGTLARVLFRNSYTLTADSEQTASRHRSGIARQDSATLPRNEFALLNYSRRQEYLRTGGERSKTPDSSIPPVPPLPDELAAAGISGKSETRSNRERVHIHSAPPISSQSNHDLVHLQPHRVCRVPETSLYATSPEASQSPQTGHSPNDSNTFKAHSPLSHSEYSTSPSSVPPASAILTSSSASYSAASGQDIHNMLDGYRITSQFGNRIPISSSSGSSNEVTDSLDSRKEIALYEGETIALVPASTEGVIGLSNLSIRRVSSEPQSLSLHHDTRRRFTASLRAGENMHSPSIPLSPTPLEPVRSNRPSVVSSTQIVQRRFRAPSVPDSATSPIISVNDLAPDSPDILDSMLSTAARDIIIRQRSGSHPDPIRIIRDTSDPGSYRITVVNEEADLVEETPSPISGMQQRFPETPRVFSPPWSASLASPLAPLSSRKESAATRALTTARHSNSQPYPLPKSANLLPPRRESAADKRHVHVVALPSVQGGSVSLVSAYRSSPSSSSSFDEAPTTSRSPSKPKSIRAGARSNSQDDGPRSLPIASTSPHRNVLRHEQPAVSNPAIGSNNSNMSLQNPEMPLLDGPRSRKRTSRIAPSPSIVVQPHSSLPCSTAFTEQPTSSTSTFIAPPSYQDAFVEQIATPPTPEYNSRGGDTSSAARRTRVRPPLPFGPRQPARKSMQSSGTLHKARNGSVSSVGTIGGDTSRKSSLSRPSGSSPAFQTSPVRFRGYTMEQAIWTLTSEQLQNLVSKAIKQSAEPSSIRLLPVEVLERDLPREVQRLENVKSDIKARFKRLTRKRDAILGSLCSHVEIPVTSDPAAHMRTLEEVMEVCASLDHLAEELHLVTDQLEQLNALRVVHSSSALAMALRKLNASFLRKVAESESLRARIATLEAERDEAWKEAQEAARDYDDLQDRYSEGTAGDASSSIKSSSRRSSRVMAVRKTSIRASKAGLRLSTSRRSRPPSTSSARPTSLISYSGTKSTFGPEDIPPVPPIPQRTVAFRPIRRTL